MRELQLKGLHYVKGKVIFLVRREPDDHCVHVLRHVLQNRDRELPVFSAFFSQLETEVQAVKIFKKLTRQDNLGSSVELCDRKALICSLRKVLVVEIVLKLE